MLKRIHIKGYKSLEDVEIELPRLALLFGPNASGKTNFLDALQLLSRFATSWSLKLVFDSRKIKRVVSQWVIGHRISLGTTCQVSIRSKRDDR